MHFVREYFESKMSEELYGMYLASLISSYSEPSKDMVEETRYLTSELKNFSARAADRKPIWNRRASEVEFYKTKMSYSLVRRTYEEVLLSEKKRVAVFRTFS